MRISEILFWNNEPTEENRSDSQLDLPQTPSNDFLTNLATAFTRHGEVKQLWRQPFGPAPPDPEPELIPDGTLEPTTLSQQAGPVETEPPAGLHRLVPLRQFRGISDG